jgi:hypothetical protein
MCGAGLMSRRPPTGPELSLVGRQLLTFAVETLESLATT